MTTAVPSNLISLSLSLSFSLFSLVPSELQLSFGHGAGRPGSGAVPAEGEQGAEQEHVQLSLSGCDSQGRSAG